MDNIYVFVIAGLMFATGFWLTFSAISFNASDGILNLPDGSNFVRVDAEQEDWCEEWVCDNEVETGEFVNCRDELTLEWIPSDLNCSDFGWDDGFFEVVVDSERNCMFRELSCDPVLECISEKLVRRRC